MSHSSIRSQVAHTGATARLARFVLAHRRLVVPLWLLLLPAGIYGASHVSNRLKTDFSLPGQPGYETAQKITHVYGNGGETDPTIVLVTLPPGRTVASEARPLGRAFDQARAAVPRDRIVDYSATGDRRLHHKRRPLDLRPPVHPGREGVRRTDDPARRLSSALAGALPPGTQVGLTGLDQLASGGSSHGPGRARRDADRRRWSARGAGVRVRARCSRFVPLLIAACSILTTLLVVLGVTTFANVSFIVLFLVSLVGLGVAIDYSLLIVTRWREEREHGRDNHDAVVAAMATAGRAVVLSGLTVAIGLLSLIVLPVPGLRSVGYGGMLIPLVSTGRGAHAAASSTRRIGPRVDWPRVRHEARASRGWTAWTRGVVRGRWAAAAVALAVLIVLIIPVFSLTTGETAAGAYAKSGSAHNTYQQLLAGGAPSGVADPDRSPHPRASTPKAVTARLEHVPGITTVARSTARDSNRAGTTILLAHPAHRDGQRQLAGAGERRPRRGAATRPA